MCNFLTRCGLHESHAMTQKRSIPPELFYVCNVFEGGVVMILKLALHRERKKGVITCAKPLPEDLGDEILHSYPHPPA